MGLQLSWIAVEGAAEGLLDRMGLEVVGETMSEVGCDLALARTGKGWTVLVSKDWPTKPDETMSLASPSGFSLCGMMTDIAMFSELRAYRDGHASWSVTRDCDKPGLAVQGSPPEPFEDIRRKLEADQAAEDQPVDHLFDAPLKLSDSLCGYLPGQKHVEWQVLQRRGKGSAQSRTPARQSLTSAIRTEVLPVLWSLGWSTPYDKPILTIGNQIVREVGAQKQTMVFEYESAREVELSVIAWTEEFRAPGQTKFVRVYVDHSPEPVSLWKRLTARHSGSAAKSAVADPVTTAIELAKSDIFEIETYLKTGVGSPRMQIDIWEPPDV